MGSQPLKRSLQSIVPRFSIHYPTGPDGPDKFLMELPAQGRQVGGVKCKLRDDKADRPIQLKAGDPGPQQGDQQIRILPQNRTEKRNQAQPPHIHRPATPEAKGPSHPFYKATKPFKGTFNRHAALSSFKLHLSHDLLVPNFAV